ncbi:MAG: TadE/TadG family type IV pilus assembly protein [Pseudomonadota bacterium]
MTRDLPKHRKSRKLRRTFLRDTSGVAAMEFALVAPMLIAMYLGLAELGMALNAERHTSHSASVAGDLATQSASINAGQAEDVVSAVLHVKQLKPEQQYAMAIQTFERLSDGTVKSEGLLRYKSGSLQPFLVDKSDFDEDILPKGTGIVAATVRYRYQPLGFTGPGAKRSFLPTHLDLEETFLLKPRQSDVLQFGPDGRWTEINCTGTVDNVSCTETSTGTP